jgi:hypothetical protein
MYPTPQNPNARAIYMNAQGQPVHPHTGMTLSKSDPWWHGPVNLFKWWLGVE